MVVRLLFFSKPGVVITDMKCETRPTRIEYSVTETEMSDSSKNHQENEKDDEEKEEKSTKAKKINTTFRMFAPTSIENNHMLLISGKSLATYLSNVLEEMQAIRTEVKPKQNLAIKSLMMHNTMSMTHSKTHSKDSSINMIKANESNVQQNETTLAYLENQWTIDLFNHKVYMYSPPQMGTYKNYTVALVVSRKSDPSWARAFAMHMFLQFYREFTDSLLEEIYGNASKDTSDKIKVDDPDQKKHQRSASSSEPDEGKNTDKYQSK